MADIIILGISCYYHDSSAALLINGSIVAAAEEERFTRHKHDNSFPVNAITYCLASHNLTIKDVDHIAFYEKPLLKFERILYQHLEKFPFSVKTFLGSIPSWTTEKLRVVRTIKTKLKYSRDILFVEHHLAHAASTFLVSPFNKAAIVTMDGVGEWATTTYGIGQDNNISLLKEIKFPHSIGLLYSTITAYLGFSVNNSEYKIMGLSAYGNMNRLSNQYYQKLRQVIDIKPDGSFRLDMSFFTYHYADKMPSRKLCQLLGGPVNKPGSPITSRHQDISAALQLITEDVALAIFRHAHQETKCKNITFSGGVALNSVLNGKILSQTPFQSIWIQPNASDGGTSLGAALFAYNTILGNKRSYIQRNCYLGPSYSTGQIQQFLDQNKIRYSQFKDTPELIQKTAQLLAHNSVVAWFQGRLEWGPRALGARSILANPGNPDAKELLNTKVKHRESFRPFAPVVCKDDAQTYFDCDQPIPAACDFMLMVYPVRKQWRRQISSIVHVDGSGRLQTIARFQNPLYYDLIKEFGKLSGIPILINTSFNIRGEPIVCTPHDAYQCMMGTGIDYLVIDNFLVKRADNIKDVWDSEKYAKD